MAYRRYCIIFLTSILFDVAVAGRGKGKDVEEERAPQICHDDQETSEGRSNHGLANQLSQYAESAMSSLQLEDASSKSSAPSIMIVVTTREDVRNRICAIVPIRSVQSTATTSNHKYDTFVTTAECANTIKKNTKATMRFRGLNFEIGLGSCIPAEEFNIQQKETCKSNVGIVNVRVQESEAAAELHANGYHLPLMTGEDKDKLTKMKSINVVLTKPYWNAEEAHSHQQLHLLDNAALCVKTDNDDDLRRGAPCSHRNTRTGSYNLLGLYSHPGKSPRYHLFVNLPYHEQLIQQLITQ